MALLFLSKDVIDMVYELSQIDETHFAYLIAVLSLNAKVVVELGTGMGWSTRYFLEALKITDGILYSVDLYPERDDVRPTIEAFKNESRIIFIKGDSVQVGQNWDRPIDILLCDSDHSEQHVLNELVAWSKSNPKIIFIHDLVWEIRNSAGVLEPKLAPPYYACMKFAQSTNRKFIYVSKKAPGLGAII